MMENEKRMKELDDGDLEQVSGDSQTIGELTDSSLSYFYFTPVLFSKLYSNKRAASFTWCNRN